MKSVGMIAEFNPLHNGHLFALRQARVQAAADAVVVVLAGNYVQRGEPAILDKWTRARLALQSGADLVVEMPTHAVFQAAPQYALGGVAQLAALGVNAIAFGTEDAGFDYAALAHQRFLAEQRTEKSAFHDYSRPFASQLAQNFAETVGVEMTAPNQMLALSYADANATLGNPLQLMPFLRQGAAHDASPAGGVVGSGSSIRAALTTDQDVSKVVPLQTAQALSQRQLVSWTDLWPLLQYRLQTASLGELQTIDQMSEGLENRFQKFAGQAADFEAFLQLVKSKRYTYARLRRLALSTVLNVTATDVQWGRAHPAVHVLGFNARGREFLHAAKQTMTWPLVSKVSADMVAPGGVMHLTARVDRLIETLTGETQNYGRVPIMEERHNA